MIREKGFNMQKNLNSNLIYNNQDGIEYIQFENLLQYPQITHCYTLRSGNKENITLLLQR